jgi:hypothetical protein
VYTIIHCIRVNSFSDGNNYNIVSIKKATEIISKIKRLGDLIMMVLFLY